MKRAAIVVGCAMTGACASPAAEPTVQVTLSHLAMSPASMYSASGAVTVFLYVSPGTAGDAGTTVDAGAAITRIIAWDGTDPFVFDVQLPEVALASARFEAQVTVTCASGGAQAVTVASGSSPLAIEPTSSTTAMIALTVDATAPPTCM